VAHSAFHQDTLAISATVPATIEAFVAPQLPALSAAGWKIHILTSPGLPTTFADHAGVTVHEVAMTRAMNPVAALLVQERVARNRPLVLGMGGSKGVDLSVFTPPPHERKVDIFSLGFVGRLSEDKGIDTVLKVLDRVRQSLPHARLIVVGDSDGTNPIDPTTMRRIESGGSIEWTGYTSDVAAQMQRLDVLVFPSQREGLPNVVIEAAACGVPTVGWDATGVRDAISDGVSGRTVRRGDIDAMVEAVLAISRQDRSTVAGSCTDWARKFDQRALTSALVGYLDDGRARG
jgi:glycosyltransferase involved in cell wall biosynthesis